MIKLTNIKKNNVYFYLIFFLKMLKITFASIVFPVPGGPDKRAPLGSLAPNSRYFPGFFKKSTNSDISFLASSNPATSLNFTKTFESIPKILAPDFPY